MQPTCKRYTYEHIYRLYLCVYARAYICYVCVCSKYLAQGVALIIRGAEFFSICNKLKDLNKRGSETRLKGQKCVINKRGCVNKLGWGSDKFQIE